ncbi:MAG: sigma-54-dependent Fis family transcriptional regulator [Bacteroidetes bacterium]|nr:MAG: sigma-54-dependent Fis family transcriptional regulator [Bacteroidota bacterium]PIE88243.1 MAG: sigma-54-dependent Fis family transcriptional regulator [Bacteroidota bacterium]
MVDIQSIKQRFGIIGNADLLNRAIDTARQVASTDLTVLITGESGVGKENFPKIIHTLSARKHGSYIAVNCGAIPEGTIDSELFGHEKGAFTGAHEARKGYFEEANNGTIFLDEVAELPTSTQVRLLRVLETGEFMRVGSSRVIKTDVRVVAATNVDIPDAIKQGKFRQDLYYRLNTIPIYIPPLRERKEDIFLLFRKFASDFAAKYHMPVLQLDNEARAALESFPWNGNVRQLKNITEQISIIEKERNITLQTLRRYLPGTVSNLPVRYNAKEKAGNEFTERELLYKVLFEMKKDITELKKILHEVVTGDHTQSEDIQKAQRKFLANVEPEEPLFEPHQTFEISRPSVEEQHPEEFEGAEIVEENLSLQKREKDLIQKALEKHNGKRKAAAKELGISERTLYRKIKEYQI